MTEVRYISRILGRLQYRLSTLLILVAIVSVPFGIHAHREQQYRFRLAAVECLSENGIMVGVEADGHDPLAWRQIRVGDDGNLLQRDEVVNYLLCGSSLTDEVVPAILALPTVRVLLVHDNLGGTPLGTVDTPLCKLAALRSFERLILDSSTVTDEGVRCIARMRSLRVLDLRKTQVSGTGLGALASLSRLEELNLAQTVFSDEAAPYLEALTSLRTLHLNGTRISDATLRSVGTLRGLTSLKLARTDITDDGFACLAGLASLENIGLGWTKITGASLAHLANMKRLKSLWLLDDDVGDDSLRHLLGCRKLEELFLADTHVSDEGLRVIRQLDLLETLSLGNCAISDAGLLQLRQMKSLKTLLITCTTVEGIKQMSVTAEGVAQFKAAMPHTQICWSDEYGERHWD